MHLTSSKTSCADENVSGTETVPAKAINSADDSVISRIYRGILPQQINPRAQKKSADEVIGEADKFPDS